MAGFFLGMFPIAEQGSQVENEIMRDRAYEYLLNYMQANNVPGMNAKWELFIPEGELSVGCRNLNNCDEHTCASIMSYMVAAAADMKQMFSHTPMLGKHLMIPDEVIAGNAPLSANIQEFRYTPGEPGLQIQPIRPMREGDSNLCLPANQVPAPRPDQDQNFKPS